MNKNEGINNKLWLSIIVPVYNAEKHLKDCLDSILCQNVNTDKYEIICIDDGSKDNSPKILDEYAKQNSNIKVNHKANEGVSVARNLGKELAIGKYIWYIDADDCICKNSLKDIIAILESNSPTLLRVAHKEVAEDYDWKTSCIDKFLVNYKSSRIRTLSVCKMVISKEFLLKNNINFIKGITRGEDGLFCDEIYANLEEQTIIEIENIIYFYRQNATSVCHQKNIESANRVIFDYIKRMEIYKYKLESSCKDAEKKRRMRETRGVILGSLLYKLPQTGLKRQDIFKILKEKKLFDFAFIKPGDKLGWFLTKKNAMTYFLLKMPIVYVIYYNVKRKKFNKKG